MALRLRASVPLREVDGAAVAEFALRAEESAWFVLEQCLAGDETPSAAPNYVADAFKETVTFWRRWVGRSSYRGRWREMVNRSAVTLKLLTSRVHGSIVASPTFGLPERVGGQRNWDYRYTWIRDASFTLYGLMRLGYTEEAGAFMRWVEARCEELKPDGSLQIMYGIDGRHELREETLPNLEGYMGSAPVRIGNAAYGHLQLDIYGELMDAIYLYDKYGEPISYDLWLNVVRFIEWVCRHWREPDESIWEVRGGRREFLYSRVLCWAAIDRAIRLAQKRSFPAPLVRWHDVRDEIHQDIFTNFWDAKKRAFAQAKGSTALDASALLMPLIRFVSSTDPRWVSTLRAIERELVSDSLVYRYRLGDGFSDGLAGDEGTFSMCSFWYVECLSRLGDLEQARFYFEKMLGYANHVGLYGEQLGSRGEHLGNFPQAFTHLALISAAYDLDRRLSGAGHTA
jgi:GH15 family glucan-1,4-alpha-glucosidase